MFRRNCEWRGLRLPSTRSAIAIAKKQSPLWGAGDDRLLHPPVTAGANQMSLNAASDYTFLTDTPPLTRDGVVLAADRMRLVADEACAIAEHLSLLSDAPERRGDTDEAMVVTEQITRAIAWLNEAQGALLFG
jgi:hypothetical protein